MGRFLFFHDSDTIPIPAVFPISDTIPRYDSGEDHSTPPLLSSLVASWRRAPVPKPDDRGDFSVSGTLQSALGYPAYSQTLARF